MTHTITIKIENLTDDEVARLAHKIHADLDWQEIENYTTAVRGEMISMSLEHYDTMMEAAMTAGRLELKHELIEWHENEAREWRGAEADEFEMRVRLNARATEHEATILKLNRM